MKSSLSQIKDRLEVAADAVWTTVSGSLTKIMDAMERIGVPRKASAISMGLIVILVMFALSGCATHHSIRVNDYGTWSVSVVLSEDNE
jgi:hypothetical protein